MVVNHGLEDRRIPGNTLAVQPDLPYRGLSIFGTGFLSRFEGSQCSAKLLEEVRAEYIVCFEMLPACNALTCRSPHTALYNANAPGILHSDKQGSLPAGHS